MDIAKATKSFLILQLYIISLFFTISKSEVIIVGGEENRWTDGFSYVSWVEDLSFTVGDVLVFEYSKTAHNVYDVDEETFRSCNTSSGVNAMYDSGDDHLELKEAKQYWFICTVDQHCQLGMKFGINVSEPIATNTTLNSPSNNTPMNHNMIKGFRYILAFSIFSMLINIV